MEAEEDLDAELERELAALGDEPRLWNSDQDLLQGLLPAPNLLTDSEDDGECSGREDEEPASMQAFKAALQKRDASMAKFEGELHQGTDESARYGSAQRGAEQQQQQHVMADHSTRGESQAGVTREQQQPQQQQGVDRGPQEQVTEMQQNVEQQQQQQQAAHPSTILPQASELLPALLQAPLQEGSEPLSQASAERQACLAELRAQEQARAQQREQQAVAVEAQNKEVQRQAEEAARRAAAELDQQRAAAMAALEAQQAEVQKEADVRRAREEEEAQRMEAERQRVEQLMAEQAAAAAKREAAALELQEQLNKQLAGHARERSAARCIERAWMRYSSDPGGRARRAAHVAVLQAAWRARDVRIMFTHMRAQHRVLLRVEAAVSAADTNGLQSALQEAEALGVGESARARVNAFHQGASNVEQRLTTAASTGTLMSFRAAVEAAQRFAPLQPRIAAATATFEERCRSAEAALDAAVADSPMQGVMSALEAASQLGVHNARMAGAVAAARARDASMARQLRDLASAPILTSVSQQRGSVGGAGGASAEACLSSSVSSSRSSSRSSSSGSIRGNSGVSQGTHEVAGRAETGPAPPSGNGAAAAAPAPTQYYDAAEFAALAARAISLGLRGDVAAAKGVLDQRRRLLALQQRQALQRLQLRPQEELQGQAEAEGDALNVTALIEEARVLGLDAEADALQQRLSARQHSLHAKIMSAAEHSTPAGLAALLRVASSWGLGADVHSTAQRVMADRRVRAVEELQRQSAEGSLTGFKRARHAALACGAHWEVDHAQQFLEHRRQCAAQSLAAACQSLCESCSSLVPMPRTPRQGNPSERAGGTSNISNSSSNQALKSTDAGASAGFPATSAPSMPPPLANIILYPPGHPLSTAHSASGSASHAATSLLAIDSSCATSDSSSGSGSGGCAAQVRRLLLFVGALEQTAGLSLAHPHLPLQAPLPSLAPMGRAGWGDAGSGGGSSSRASRLAAAAAEILPAQPPPPLLALLGVHLGQQQGGQQGHGDMEDAARAEYPPVQGGVPQGALSALQEGGAAAWSALREVLLLGMGAHARLALGAMRLSCLVNLAEGTHCVASRQVHLDYWGTPRLSPWPAQHPHTTTDTQEGACGTADFDLPESDPQSMEPGSSQGTNLVLENQPPDRVLSATCDSEDHSAAAAAAQICALNAVGGSASGPDALGSAALGADPRGDGVDGADVRSTLGNGVGGQQGHSGYPSGALRAWPQAPPFRMLVAHLARSLRPPFCSPSGISRAPVDQSVQLEGLQQQQQQLQQQWEEGLQSIQQVLRRQQQLAWVGQAQQPLGTPVGSGPALEHEWRGGQGHRGGMNGGRGSSGVVLDYGILSCNCMTAAQPSSNQSHVQRVGPAPGDKGGNSSKPGVSSMESGLAHVERLDLRLERLTSLQGLDGWCPNLKVLLASGNSISSWAGLGGLSCLKELRLSDNCMGGAQGCPGVPSQELVLPQLCSLHLDANGLQQVSCFAQLSLGRLHTLSLANNQLPNLLLPPWASQKPGVDGSPSCQEASVPEAEAKHLASTQCTAAAGPMPGAGVAWAGGLSSLCPLARCAASLTTLDVSHNRLTTLSGLAACPSLTHLDAAHNSLNDAGLLGGALEGCTHLRFLRLSHNQLIHWPHTALATMPLLEHIDLSCNAIENLAPDAHDAAVLGRKEARSSSSSSKVPLVQDVHSLHRLQSNSQAAVGAEDGNALASKAAAHPLLLLPPSLKVLLLRDNRVSALPPLQGSPLLTHLDLSFNLISSPLELPSLSTCADTLTLLQLNDNPICAHPSYQPMLQAMLPFLMELDNQPIPASQRAHNVVAACCSSPLLVIAARRMAREGRLPSYPALQALPSPQHSAPPPPAQIQLPLEGAGTGEPRAAGSAAAAAAAAAAAPPAPAAVLPAAAPHPFTAAEAPTPAVPREAGADTAAVFCVSNEDASALARMGCLCRFLSACGSEAAIQLHRCMSRPTSSPNPSSLHMGLADPMSEGPHNSAATPLEHPDPDSVNAMDGGNHPSCNHTSSSRSQSGYGLQTLSETAPRAWEPARRESHANDDVCEGAGAWRSAVATLHTQTWVQSVIARTHRQLSKRGNQNSEGQGWEGRPDESRGHVARAAREAGDRQENGGERGGTGLDVQHQQQQQQQQQWQQRQRGAAGSTGPWTEAGSNGAAAWDEPSLVHFFSPLAPGASAAGGGGPQGSTWAVVDEGEEGGTGCRHGHGSRMHPSCGRARPAIGFSFGATGVATSSHTFGFPFDAAGQTTHSHTLTTSQLASLHAHPAPSGATAPDPYGEWFAQGVQRAQRVHLAELRARAGLGSGAVPKGPSDAEGRQWGEMIVRSSYVQRVQQHVFRSAACIQAAWRALQARREAQALRSEAHQHKRAAAALTLQRVWRGRAVRTGPVLLGLLGERAAKQRAEALAQEQAAQVAAEARRSEVETAVVCLQSFIRARAVRKRLQAAKQAARYVDSDDEEEYAGVDDSFLDDVAGLLGEIPSSTPAAAARPPFMGPHNRSPSHTLLPQQQQQQQQQQGQQQGPPQDPVTSSAPLAAAPASTMPPSPAIPTSAYPASTKPPAAAAMPAGGGMAAAVASKMAQLSHLTRAFAAKTGRGGALLGRDAQTPAPAAQDPPAPDAAAGYAAAPANPGGGSAHTDGSAGGASSAASWAANGASQRHPAPIAVAAVTGAQPNGGLGGVSTAIAGGLGDAAAVAPAGAWEGHTPMARARLTPPSPPPGPAPTLSRVPSLPPLKPPPLASTTSYNQLPAQNSSLHPSHTAYNQPPGLQPLQLETSVASSAGGAYGGGYGAPESESGDTQQLYSSEDGGSGSELMSPASQTPSSVAAQNNKLSKHREKLAALMQEWGFKDEATAEVFLRRQQRVTQGATRAKKEARFKDPRSRWRKLQNQVEQRPRLRPEEVAPMPVHGPPLPLHKGSLRGPPSREHGQSHLHNHHHEAPGASAGASVPVAADMPGGSTPGSSSSPHHTPRALRPHPSAHPLHAASKHHHPHQHPRLFANVSGGSAATSASVHNLLLSHPHPAAAAPPFARPPSAGASAGAGLGAVVGAKIGGAGSSVLPALMPQRRPTSLPEPIEMNPSAHGHLHNQHSHPYQLGGHGLGQAMSMRHRGSREREDDEGSVRSAASAPDALGATANPTRNGRPILLPHLNPSNSAAASPMAAAALGAKGGQLLTPQSNNWVSSTPTAAAFHSQQQQQQQLLLQQQAGLLMGGNNSGSSSSGGSAAKLLLSQQRQQQQQRMLQQQFQ